MGDMSVIFGGVIFVTASKGRRHFENFKIFSADVDCLAATKSSNFPKRRLRKWLFSGKAIFSVLLYAPINTNPHTHRTALATTQGIEPNRRRTVHFACI